ncbi:MAG TPA: hypothetical protein VJ385_10705 [Fibrobacteria bacterium]|nr:hypothetical protein [Fibrobacteria bacterium]
MDDFVPIASSAERASLERLEKYLSHHGILCHVRQDDRNGEKFHLLVSPPNLNQAQRVLDDIAYSSIDPDNAEEALEIRFDGSERIEVATWLQILLDEEDHEGSPVYFFRGEYEAILDELHASGRVEIPLYILKGLKSFIPEGPKRMVMGSGLQEFFALIEAVAKGEV